jgi:transposase
VTASHALFRRLSKRRGAKRAATAVGHSQLVTIYHMLSGKTQYRDLGAAHLEARPAADQDKAKMVSRLEAMGYKVTLTAAA